MGFVIPTIFTAADKMSMPIAKMTMAVDQFASKTETAIARADRNFRRLTPSLSGVTRQLMSFASDAAIFTAGAFAVNSIMDYETELANLSAVTGTSGKDLLLFKSQIKAVATQTKESSVDVAKAFTAIGNNQPQLLKDAEGLGMVAKASIVLARASKMELGPAAEALTSIMNQYSIPAREAGRTIDYLAAASQAGSAELVDVAASLQKFGPIAVTAGIKINESLALIESGSKFFKEGHETGTKFLNIITTMASLKVQDPKALHDLKRLGVNMSVVTSKTIPFADRLKELSKIAKDVPALFHVFGKENLAMASSILNSTQRYDELLKKMDEQGKAQEMADKNNATLRRGLQQLVNKFVTWITTSDEAAKAIDILKDIVRFLADHLTTIIKIIGWVTAAFIAWRFWIIALKIQLIAMRAWAAALFLVDMIKYIASTQGLTFAQAAWAIVTESCTAAMAALNAMMLANPIGLIIIGIVALIAVITVIINKWNEWGAALTIFLGPLGKIISLVQAFRRNWDMISQSFQEGGILAALKSIGKTIYDSILQPIQQLMTIIARLTGFDWASSMASSIGKMREGMGVNVTSDENGQPLQKTPINNSSNQHEALMEKIERTNNAKVDINIRDPKGRTDAQSNSPGVNITSSSTMAWAGTAN